MPRKQEESESEEEEEGGDEDEDENDEDDEEGEEEDEEEEEEEESVATPSVGNKRAREQATERLEPTKAQKKSKLDADGANFWTAEMLKELGMELGPSKLVKASEDKPEWGKAAEVVSVDLISVGTRFLVPGAFRERG